MVQLHPLRLMNTDYLRYSHPNCPGCNICKECEKVKRIAADIIDCYRRFARSDSMRFRIKMLERVAKLEAELE